MPLPCEEAIDAKCTAPTYFNSKRHELTAAPAFPTAYKMVGADPAMISLGIPVNPRLSVPNISVDLKRK